MEERACDNQKIWQMIKYFMLSVIVFGISLFAGGKTVSAKLNVSGDTSLLVESKCTQTFDGTQDFVIWCNPAAITNGVWLVVYQDGAEGGIYDSTGEELMWNREYVKSVDKNGKIVLRKEAILELNSYMAATATPYLGNIGLSVGSGGKSASLTLSYDLTNIKNKKYTIVYDTNGGKAIKNRSVRLYEKFPNVTPTRKGYTFTGWIQKKNNYNQKIGDWTVVCHDMTVVATWKAVNYTISYKYNGGNESTEKGNPTSYTVNSRITLASPVRTGYKFEGWYTDKKYKNKIKKISGKTGNLTLYAKWSPKKYQITFQSNGGSKIKKKLNVSYNSKFGKLPVSKRKGFKFEGWYTQKDGGTKITAKTNVTITRSMTLYAHWKAAK